MQDLIREEPSLGEPLHESFQIDGAQIVRAARHEMARTVEDVLARRTRAPFLNARATIAIAPAAAGLLARELGCDQGWQQRQLAAFHEVAAHFLPLS